MINSKCKYCKKNFQSKTKKTVCNECKKERKKLTKSYIKKQAKKELRKKDREWSLEIRKEPCLICGTTNKLNAHHIIPREIKKFRHDLNNGVSCCVLHHKFCRKISFHKNPVVALFILKQKKPEQYKWLMDTIEKFLTTERFK